jgi:drug/metabolite transporter (DMT)-like permease
VIHLLAVMGMVCISFSAVFVRLAHVSPVTATFFRAAYAVPILLAIWLAQRAGDLRTARHRWLALASGVILAVDLNLWHESIALIGAGLGTVIANVQVVFVAMAAWLLYGERQTRLRAATIVLVLAGIAMTSGLARHDAYGSRPIAGAIFGLVAGMTYASFLLVYRAANQATGPRSGPLLDSTVGMLAGAFATSVLDPQFTFTPPTPSANLWLALLAIVSQVAGWWLIGGALPKLPAVETSVLLLGQPVVTVVWGVLIFKERLSAVQWVGSAIVLIGVGALSLTGASPQSPRQPDVRSQRRRSYSPAI